MSELAGLPERFWAKTSIEDRGHDTPCVIWTASTFSNGYGQFRLEGRTRRTHRVAYEVLAGQIPDGLELDHLCRVRACIAADHLEPVTHAENVRRAPWGAVQLQASKTHCPQGHPYDEENTYADPRGWRGCLACRREPRRAAATNDAANEIREAA